MAEIEYTYYPGCSLDATGKAYDVSTRAVFDFIGVGLRELPDWNCCGATAYLSTDDVASMAVAARNLALAERIGLDLVTPCSACYITLSKTNHYFHDYPEVREKMQRALAVGGLEYNGGVEVRHLLYVFADDIVASRCRNKVLKTRPDLKVAPYYGCQVVRPFTDKDSPDIPVLMDEMITALGSQVVDYPLKTKCCGGSLIGFDEKTSLALVHSLLECAVQNGADCIVTCCPLCQVNLDVYQFKVNRLFKTNYHIPVLFFTQLVGLALGIDEEKLGLEMGIEDYKPALKMKGA